MEPFNVKTCPRCKCVYSSNFPDPSSSSFCHLPLLLNCGHAICFDCVKSIFVKTQGSKLSIMCSNCVGKTEMQRKLVFRNVIPLIHWYLLGLTHLPNYELHIQFQQLGFKDSPSDLNTATMSVSSDEGKKRCQEHGKTLRLWCIQDKEMVCKKCPLNGIHKDHRIVPLDEQNLSTLTVLEESITKSKEMIDKLTAKFGMFQSISNTLKIEYNQAADQVRIKYAHLHGVLLKYESETHKLLQSQLDSRTKYFQNARLQFGKIHRRLGDLIRDAESAVQNKFNSPLRTNHLLEKLEKKLDTCQGAIDTIVQLSSQKKGPTLILSPQYEDYFRSAGRTLITVENVEEVENLFETETAEPVEESQEESIVTGNQTIPDQMKSQGHSLIVGSSFVGYVSHVRPVRPTKCFYIQPLMNQCEEFRRLQKELELTGSSAPSSLHEGMLVAARYQADQVWYRGLIQALKTDGATIFFIDFGNKEFVSFESIRTLEKQHQSLPAQAVLCSLSSRKHGSLDRINSSFKASVEERILGVYIEEIRPGRVGHIGDNLELKFFVTLYECEQGPANNFNILMNAMLKFPTPQQPQAESADSISKNDPTPSSSIPASNVSPYPSAPSSSTSSLIPHAPVEQMAAPLYVPPIVSKDNIHKIRVELLSMESPGCFFVRPTDNKKAYQTLRSQLEEYFCFRRPVLVTKSELAVGGVYAVRWSIDENWERCRVESIEKDHMILILIDAGFKVKVTHQSIYQLDPRWLDKTDAKALRCSLWGLKPAGGSTTWSRTSIDRMAEFLKKGYALFIETYNVADDVHFVRLYFEFVKQGEEIECDTSETSCVNDDLMELGLALRNSMPVAQSLRIKEWIPALPLLTGRSFQAEPVWVDDLGNIYLHFPGKSPALLSKMSLLFNAYFAKSEPTDEEMHWAAGQPCIVKRNQDQIWYRCRVVGVDDAAQTCTVQYVDYGDSEEGLPFSNMRKTLLCQTYPIQAATCCLNELQGLKRPVMTSEADMLHKALVEKTCNVVVVDPDALIPRVTIKVTDPSSNFPSVLEFIKLAAGKMEVVEKSEAEALEDSYQPLSLPLGTSVPIKILSVKPDMSAVIQPLDCVEHTLPEEWRMQVARYTCYQKELQKDAPNSAILNEIVHGSACAVLNSDDNLWYRGVIQGRCDNQPSQVRVHLVDLGRVIVVDASSVRKLSQNYLKMNRHCATICLKETPTKPAAYYMNKMGPIDGPDSDFWVFLEPQEDGCEVAYPIAHLMYRKDGHLTMIF